MKRELELHLLPLIGIYFFVSIVWLIFKVNYLEFIFLFLGLALASFFPDVDHLIYWFYLNPDTEESRQAKIALETRDWRSLLHLFAATRHHHTSLVFHHFFFQVALALLSLFVFTSSDNVFTMGLLLALNLHLLVDETNDYYSDPAYLQRWLFAREDKQLPRAYLPHYLITFTAITILYLCLLIRSRI